MADKINEETTFSYTAQLADYTGAALPLSSIEGCLATVYDVESSTVLRPTSDGLNVNRVTIDAAGVLTYEVLPYETRFVAPDALAGASEEHALVFRFNWNASGINSLSGPFSVTDESSDVTVTSALHGLAADDHVSFVSSATVGGINMNGLHIVTSVVDANTYTVSAHCAATSTDASGGGSVDESILPDTSTHTYKFKVIKRAVHC